MKGDVRTRFDFKRAGADHDVHEHPEVNPRSNSAARQQRRAAQAQAHGIVNERRRKKAHQTIPLTVGRSSNARAKNLQRMAQALYRMRNCWRFSCALGWKAKVRLTLRAP